MIPVASTNQSTQSPTSPGSSIVLGRPTITQRVSDHKPQAVNTHSAHTHSLPRADEVSLPKRWRRAIEVIDMSESMKVCDLITTRLECAKDSARRYAEASAVADPRNEIAVITYNDYAHVVCGFISCRDDDELNTALDSIGSFGNTNIAAGLAAAEELFLGADDDCGQVELVVKLLTDGFHNCQDDPREVAERLRDLGVIIDVVGIGGDSLNVDEDLLKEIASLDNQGIPRYRFIGDPERLIEHSQRMAGRLTR